MRDIQRAGDYADIVTAPSSQLNENLRLGLRTSTFRDIQKRGMPTLFAQYYGIVQEGIQSASHLFQGLNRPLLRDGDMNADRSMRIYSWKPLEDFFWLGSPRGGSPTSCAAPQELVFVVLVRMFDAIDVTGIAGTIEKWNWVREDPRLDFAPVDWSNRYDEKLWSRLT